MYDDIKLKMSYGLHGLSKRYVNIVSVKTSINRANRPLTYHKACCQYYQAYNQKKRQPDCKNKDIPFI